MIAIALCLLSFALTFAAARRSLAHGLAALLAVGYFYGIARANFAQAASHFIFDAAVVALYLAWLKSPERSGLDSRNRTLIQWLQLLAGWPLLLLFLPVQDPLIQLVGLRGNIFLLPLLLLGADLFERRLRFLSLTLAALNLIALVFAGAEYSLGIERFFPYSPVTEIIYRSNDLIGYQAHRIPATFTSAHAYAGTMVVTVPFLIGAWVQEQARRWHGYLLAGGLFAALLGVFMAAARSHALVLLILLAVASFSARWRGATRIGWLVILLGVGWLVASEERLQRFTTLRDTDYVAQRIAGSISVKFLDLAAEYPLGNGLGGGGTSVPYFLQSRLRKPATMENEYARILLEQGLPGLALWLAFLAWVFLRRTNAREDPWFIGRRLAWVASLTYFATGLIGVGLLTSVPQTCLLLLSTGWIALPTLREPVPELEEGDPASAAGSPEPLRA